MASNTTNAKKNAPMLDTAIFKQQAGTHGPHIGSFSLGN
jgi:hypothetical protein